MSGYFIRRWICSLRFICVLFFGTLLSTASLACTNLNATCQDIGDLHDETRDDVNDAIDEIIEDYEEWWTENFWEEGLAPMLPPAQKQISVSIQKTTELKSTINTHQTQTDAMTTINSEKAHIMVSQIQSKALCTAATLSGAMIAAQEDSRRVLGESMNGARAIATGHSAIADKKLWVEARKENTICKYADEDASNKALGIFCAGFPVPSDTDQGLAHIGGLNTMNSFGDKEQEALNAHIDGMTLSHPASGTTEDPNNPAVQIAYQKNRQVTAQRLLTNYCLKKTYQSRMGGNKGTDPFLKAVLEEKGIEDPTVIPTSRTFLGENNSSYAQKQVQLLQLKDPSFAVSSIDTPENTLRLSNHVKSQTVSNLYDQLETFDCSQMMSGLMLAIALQPVRNDLKERINKTRAERVSSHNTDPQDINVAYQGAVQ